MSQILDVEIVNEPMKGITYQDTADCLDLIKQAAADVRSFQFRYNHGKPMISTAVGNSFVDDGDMILFNKLIAYVVPKDSVKSHLHIVPDPKLEYEILKNRFIDLYSSFYNEHSESDKEWYERQFHALHDPINKNNRVMDNWAIGLHFLKNCYDEIKQYKAFAQDFENLHQELTIYRDYLFDKYQRQNLDRYFGGGSDGLDEVLGRLEKMLVPHKAFLRMEQA